MATNNEKMSKSRGNVINPDDIVSDYGADTLRMYEMFMGPLEATKPWNTNGVEGIYRFLSRVWRLFINENGQAECENRAMTKHWQRCVQTDLAPYRLRKLPRITKHLRFNTAISQMMIFVNDAYKTESLPRRSDGKFRANAVTDCAAYCRRALGEAGT